MPTQAIQNSTIRNVSWNEGALTIEFKKGSRYRYFHVLVDHFYKIAVTKKPIKYYRDNIRGKHQSIKLKPNQL